MPHPCPQTYALRLSPSRPDELLGEIEHVLTGERQRFADAAELVAALMRLRRRLEEVAPRAT